MNDQTGFPNPDLAFKKRPRVALMVDGDNIASSQAGTLIMRAITHGNLAIRRVYGNFANLPSWSEAPGFKLVHAGTGKNAADLLLSVEAMKVMLQDQADILVVATSDGDFAHLALTLVEMGHVVIGIGESKAPEKFRKACTSFELLTMIASPVAQKTRSTVDATILELIAATPGKGNAILLDSLGKLLKDAGLSATANDAATWSSYFRARPSIYHVRGEGKDLRIAAVKP